MGSTDVDSSFSGIRRAAGLVHGNPRLVLLLACTGAYVTCHTAAIFTAASLALSIFFLPAVYARLAQQASGAAGEGMLQLFVRYAPTYFGTLALFYGPVLVASFLVRADRTEAFLTVMFGTVQVLALFVLPLLFRSERSLNAVAKGLRLLATNLGRTYPLVLLAVAVPVLGRAVPTEWYAIDLSSLHAGLRTVPVAYVYLLMRSYGDAVVFSAACLSLKELPEPLHAGSMV